jgi:uncharacterized protein with gpF-like domain
MKRSLLDKFLTRKSQGKPPEPEAAQEKPRSRMEAAGLKMYVWETAGDGRVKPACKKMDGKLCLRANHTVYSRNKGKDWISRPKGAVLAHPGEGEGGCRCTALAYEPEILGEI